MRKYGNTSVYTYCTDLFDYLPIGAIIDQQTLCLHGGLSPDIKTIDQLRTIQRKQEIPLEGPLADIMWSDPSDEIKVFERNSRGAGWLFGEFVVKIFCQINGLSELVRAHQLV